MTTLYSDYRMSMTIIYSWILFRWIRVSYPRGWFYYRLKMMNTYLLIRRIYIVIIYLVICLLRWSERASIKHKYSKFRLIYNDQLWFSSSIQIKMIFCSLQKLLIIALSAKLCNYQEPIQLTGTNAIIASGCSWWSADHYIVLAFCFTALIG